MTRYALGAHHENGQICFAGFDRVTNAFIYQARQPATALVAVRREFTTLFGLHDFLLSHAPGEQTAECEPLP